MYTPRPVIGLPKPAIAVPAAAAGSKAGLEQVPITHSTSYTVKIYATYGIEQKSPVSVNGRQGV